MEIDPDERLHDTSQLQIGTWLPAPLSGRLDALVNRASEAGESTNRTELIAALLFDAPADGDRIAETLKRYRRASVQDAMVDGEDPSLFLEPRRQRGPRPGRRGPRR